jgi:hypothetical protein
LRAGIACVALDVLAASRAGKFEFSHNVYLKAAKQADLFEAAMGQQTLFLGNLQAQRCG